MDFNCISAKNNKINRFHSVVFLVSLRLEACAILFLSEPTNQSEEVGRQLFHSRFEVAQFEALPARLHIPGAQERGQQSLIIFVSSFSSAGRFVNTALNFCRVALSFKT